MVQKVGCRSDCSAWPIDAARNGESEKLAGGFAVQLKLTLTFAACALLRTDDCQGVQISMEVICPRVALEA